jgi:small redox-active disulfide protein 2
MKKLQVLGPGCPKCQQLAVTAEAAAKSLNLDCQIEKVTDLRQIMSFGIMSTPALVVDGIVKVSGRVPSLNEVKTLLR